MRLIKYLLVGAFFGILMAKSEAFSWYRIQEMFRFQAFHMYGIIMTAVAVGLIGIQIIKRKKVNDIKGTPIVIQDKEKGTIRYWIGGLIFGLGWALVGSCPGPIFILIGAGFSTIFLVFLGALLGTFIYGVIKDYLPH